MNSVIVNNAAQCAVCGSQQCRQGSACGWRTVQPHLPQPAQDLHPVEQLQVLANNALHAERERRLAGGQVFVSNAPGQPHLLPPAYIDAKTPTWR